MSIIVIISSAALLAVAAWACVSAKRSGKKCPVDIAVVLTAAALLVFGIGMIPFKEGEVNPMVAQMEQALQEMPGQEAPDFSGVSVQGDTLSLSDYTGKGKYVLLDFWASWCGPCRRYMPIIRDVYDEYTDRGLVILGVNVNDSPAKARDLIGKSDMVWDILITEGTTVQMQYNCLGIPSCYLISPEGVILEAGVHPMQLKETIKKYFEDEQ